MPLVFNSNHDENEISRVGVHDATLSTNREKQQELTSQKDDGIRPHIKQYVRARQKDGIYSNMLNKNSYSNKPNALKSLPKNSLEDSQNANFREEEISSDMAQLPYQEGQEMPSVVTLLNARLPSDATPVDIVAGVASYALARLTMFLSGF